MLVDEPRPDRPTPLGFSRPDGGDYGSAGFRYGGILVDSSLRPDLGRRRSSPPRGDAPSRLSTTTIVLAALCYLLATAARFDWFVVDDQRQRVMIEHGAIVFGNFLFFIAITLYSRHVLLDAQGLLRRRKGKEPLTAAKRESARKKAPASPTTKQDTPEDSTADGDRTFAVHAPHDRVEQPPADVLPTPVPESGAPSATSTPAVEQAADEQTSDAVKGSENRKLSKAERRRLRAEARAGQTPSIPRETLKPS